MGARVSSGSRGYRDEAVSAFLNGFFCETIVDDVVEGNSSVTVCRLIHPFFRTQRGDHDRDFIFNAHFHVILEAGIRTVNDLIDRKWRCGRVRVLLIVPIKFFRDAL